MIQPLAILLATYNGARFLPAQLDSLLGQSDGDFIILARDDGSQDGTPEILADYAARQPSRIQVLSDARGRLGPVLAFDALLEQGLAHPAGFNGFMFCDQDDIWLPDKVRRLRELAAPWMHRGPLLAHCDMAVVAEDLTPIAPSYWRAQRLAVQAPTLDRLLIQNVVTGHSCLCNRPLADLARPIPADSAMHDWWLALTAAGFGRILALDEPLSLYRQHSANVLGSRTRRWTRFLSPTHWREKILKGGNYASAFAQADAWLGRYADRLPSSQMRRLQRLQGISASGYLGRRWRMLVSGVHPRDPVTFIDFLLKC